MMLMGGREDVEGTAKKQETEGKLCAEKHYVTF